MDPRALIPTARTSAAARVASVLTTVVLVACGANDDKSSAPESADTAVVQIGTVTVSESECSLERAVENPVSAGSVALTAVNDTGASATIHMWSLLEGTTYEEFARYVEEERRLAEAGEEGKGHPPFVQKLIATPTLKAGQSATMRGTISSGETYGIVCLKMFEGDEVPRPLGIVGPVEVG